MLPTRRTSRPSNIKPFEDIMSAFDHMTRDFDRIMHGYGLSPIKHASQAAFVPVLDVADFEDRYVVELECPGVAKEDLDVSVTSDGNLVIKGNKEVNRDADMYIQERLYGSFHRELKLPESADKDSITVTCRDGVLTVTIPKEEQKANETRKLQIED